MNVAQCAPGDHVCEHGTMPAWQSVTEIHLALGASQLCWASTARLSSAGVNIGVIDSLMQNASVCFDCRLAACVRVAGPNVRRRGILGADRSIRWRGSGTRGGRAVAVTLNPKRWCK